MQNVMVEEREKIISFLLGFLVRAGTACYNRAVVINFDDKCRKEL